MVNTNRAGEIVAALSGIIERGSTYTMVAQERLSFFSSMYEIDVERIHERAVQLAQSGFETYIDCIQKAAKELSGE